MSRAITHMELLEDGSRVTIKLKSGGSRTWNINDIRKGANEKELVTTFADPYLFPIDVKGEGRFYFYGHGHQAIKDGELFRAVINGKSVEV